MAQKGSLVGALIDAGIISAVAVRRVITVINELSAQNLWFIDILIKYAFAIIDQRLNMLLDPLFILGFGMGTLFRHRPCWRTTEWSPFHRS